MVMIGFFPSHLSVCVCALMLLFFKPMKLTFWTFFAWIWANRKMSMFSMFTGACAIRHWSIEINAYVDCWRNYVPSCQCCKRTKIIRTKNQKNFFERTNVRSQLCTMYYRFACVQVCLYAALFFFVSSIFLSLRLRQTSTNCCYRAMLATWLYMGFFSVKSYNIHIYLSFVKSVETHGESFYFGFATFSILQIFVFYCSEFFHSIISMTSSKLICILISLKHPLYFHDVFNLVSQSKLCFHCPPLQRYFFLQSIRYFS